MPFLIFLSGFLLYLATLAPSFTVGDAGEFCAAGATLGLPHSPGYPLFCLLGKAVISAVPWGNMAFRMNVLSAAFGAGTLAVLYAAVKSVLPDSGAKKEKAVVLAALAAAFLALTPAFWRSSVQTEVFTVNTFFAALLLWTFVKRYDHLSLFIFGLGLGNHHTLVFLGPLVAAGIVRSGRLSLKRAGSLPLFFALGFSVYIYLTVRSFKNPGLDWGNPETLHNLWRVISRADYGSLSLTTGEKMARSAAATWAQIVRFVSLLQDQFTWAGIAVGIAGWYRALKNGYPLSRITLFTWCLAGPGFLLLANLPFNAESEGILERFYILSNLFWVFPLAWGLEWLYERSRALTAAASCCMLIVLCVLRFPSVDWRQYYLAYDYGRNLLRTLPRQAVLFMDGGDDTFYSLAYLCFAERRRPDVELHDRGGLVFRNVYGPDFRKIPKSDKELRRREIERMYALTRPVYFSTFNKEVMPGAELAADGILYRPLRYGPANAYPAYSLRSVYGARYYDYRSRALVPLYPYFEAFYEKERALDFWNYAYRNWPETLWLRANLRVELLHAAFREFSEGRLENADALYAQTAAWFPEEASALVNRGVIQEKLRRPDKAKEYYLKALEVDPRYADACYNIAVVNWQEGKWQEVVRYLRRLLEINPNDPRALRYLPEAEQRSQISNLKSQIKGKP